MTREKFVVRLLDEAHHLLAWTTVWAVPHPIGGGRSCPFWPEQGPTQFVVTRDGEASILVVHWCDLDLARMVNVPPTVVSVGQVLNFGWLEPVWLTEGMQHVPLPAVTVTAPVTLGVPVGTLVSDAGGHRSC